MCGRAFQLAMSLAFSGIKSRLYGGAPCPTFHTAFFPGHVIPLNHIENSFQDGPFSSSSKWPYFMIGTIAWKLPGQIRYHEASQIVCSTCVMDRGFMSQGFRITSAVTQDRNLSQGSGTSGDASNESPTMLCLIQYRTPRLPAVSVLPAF